MRIVIRSAALLAAVMLAGSAQAGEKKVTKIVEVAGKKYKVQTTGPYVRVADKAFFTRRSPEAADRLRGAVKAATGCSIVDDYWEGAVLEGRLMCKVTR